MSRRRVVIHETRRAFEGFLNVDEMSLSFESYTGVMIGPVTRQVMERGDAVAAILYDAATDEIVLTEQFRPAAHFRGEGWLMEAVAGGIEWGEDAQIALRREAAEELGYELSDITHLHTCFTSPGGSTERLFAYAARIAGRIGAGGGCYSENEDIREVRLNTGDFFRDLDAGRFSDSKLIIAGYALRHRLSSWFDGKH